jgi:hypothetical protein
VLPTCRSCSRCARAADGYRLTAVERHGAIASPSRFTPRCGWRVAPAGSRTRRRDRRRGPARFGSVAAAVSAAARVKDSLELTCFRAVARASCSEAPPASSTSIVDLRELQARRARHAFEPLDLVGSFARASAAPMYAQLSSYVGEGSSAVPCSLRRRRRPHRTTRRPRPSTSTRRADASRGAHRQVVRRRLAAASTIRA